MSGNDFRLWFEKLKCGYDARQMFFLGNFARLAGLAPATLSAEKLQTTPIHEDGGKGDHPGVANGQGLASDDHHAAARRRPYPTAGWQGVQSENLRLRRMRGAPIAGEPLGQFFDTSKDHVG